MPSYVPRGKTGGLARHAAPFQPANQHQKDTYLCHVRGGNHAGEARAKARLTWALFKHAVASDPEFRQAVEDIDQFLVDKLADVAYVMAHARDGPMLRWWLENARPESFGKNRKIEVSHRFESVEDIKAMSDDDIEVTFREMEAEGLL